MNNKTKIYVIVLIWAAVMIQLFVNNAVNREEVLVEQVMSEGVESICEGSVKVYAYYSSENISRENGELMLTNLCSGLGITSGCEISCTEDEKRRIISCVKNGAYGDTEMKLISLKTTDSYNQPVTENYILTEICLKNGNGTRVYELKEKLTALYEELGMKGNTNILLCTMEPGRLQESEQSSIADKFMTDMDAKEVKRIEFENVTCIYGYSSNIDEFVYQDNQRVNVNIAFSYDEAEDVTKIYKAVPFVDRSF